MTKIVRLEINGKKEEIEVEFHPLTTDEGVAVHIDAIRLTDLETDIKDIILPPVGQLAVHLIVHSLTEAEVDDYFAERAYERERKA